MRRQSPPAPVVFNRDTHDLAEQKQLIRKDARRVFNRITESRGNEARHKSAMPLGPLGDQSVLHQFWHEVKPTLLHDLSAQALILTVVCREATLRMAQLTGANLSGLGSCEWIAMSAAEFFYTIIFVSSLLDITVKSLRTKWPWQFFISSSWPLPANSLIFRPTGVQAPAQQIATGMKSETAKSAGTAKRISSVGRRRMKGGATDDRSQVSSPASSNEYILTGSSSQKTNIDPEKELLQYVLVLKADIERLNNRIDLLGKKAPCRRRRSKG
jgi:hypothetical protein